jgi:hypothetical protein
MDNLRSHCPRAATLLLCALLLPGSLACATWEAVPLHAGIQDRESGLIGRTVRLIKGNSTRVVQVSRVDYPYLEGSEEDWQHRLIPVRLDVREFDRLELKDDSPTPARVLGVIGVLTAILAAVFLLLLANYHPSD